MRSKAVVLVMTALAASLAPGQTPAEPKLNRVFHPGHSLTAQDLQEIVSTLRSTADLRQGSIDNATGDVAVQGTASQIALAEWLFYELDRPASGVTPPPTHEYRVASDDIARVFYLAHVETARDLQEIATNIRATADIIRLFTNTARAALVVRGTANQIRMAEWLVSELDTPAGLRPAAQGHEYRVPGAPDDIVRVFYLAYARAPQDLQDMATIIRATADLRRVFTYGARAAVVSRGMVSQIGMAVWLVNELDKPAGRQDQHPAAHEYRVPGASDDVLRVFYPTNIATERDLQEIAAAIRSKADIRRSFSHRAQRAVVLRGTAGQMAQAESLIQAR